MYKYPVNFVKFDNLKKLGLPFGQYAITSSGPLGVRDLREISDIDLVVTKELWNKLAKKYELFEEFGIIKIRVNKYIEVLGEGSFYCNHFKDAPTIEEQISSADIIDGLPFVNLNYILYFKKHIKRPKDLADIELIKTYL